MSFHNVCLLCVYEDAYGTTNVALLSFYMYFKALFAFIVFEDPPIIIIMTQTDVISQQINNQRHSR